MSCSICSSRDWLRAIWLAPLIRSYTQQCHDSFSLCDLTTIHSNATAAVLCMTTTGRLRDIKSKSMKPAVVLLENAVSQRQRVAVI
jgi:hypothetical protein